MDEHKQNERLRRYEELVDRIVELGVAERTATRIVIMVANNRHREPGGIERIVEAKDPSPKEVITLPRRIP